MAVACLTETRSRADARRHMDRLSSAQRRTHTLAHNWNSGAPRPLRHTLVVAAALGVRVPGLRAAVGVVASIAVRRRRVLRGGRRLHDRVHDRRWRRGHNSAYRASDRPRRARVPTRKQRRRTLRSRRGAHVDHEHLAAGLARVVVALARHLELHHDADERKPDDNDVVANRRDCDKET